MNWRDLLAGAAITLLVTILSGVAIYFITRNPPEREAIYYSISEGGTFGTRTPISFVTLEIGNHGQAPANGVRLVARTSAGGLLRDKRIDAPSGLQLEIVDRSNPRQLDVFVPRLLPNETLRISLLISGRAPLQDISLRSSDSLGERRNLPEEPEPFPFAEIISVLLAALILQFFLILAVRKLTKFVVGREITGDVGRNNVAFLLLHRNMIDEALEILQEIIKQGKPGPYELTNFAVASAVKGNMDAATDEIEAALWWSHTYFRNKHATAVALFGRSLIRAERGEMEAALDDLGKALKLGGKNIAQFARYSLIFGRHAQAHPELRKCVDSLQPTRGNPRRFWGHEI